MTAEETRRLAALDRAISATPSQSALAGNVPGAQRVEEILNTARKFEAYLKGADSE